MMVVHVTGPLQYKNAMVLSTIKIRNKVFLHYKMVFNEILNRNLYLFVLTG